MDSQEMNSIDTKDHKIHTNNEEDVRDYKLRWIILLLFILSQTSSVIQVTQYVVVTNVIREYYQVSYTAIEWTTMIYSLLYTIIILPGSHILEKLGLRKAVLIGSIGTLIGTCIKFGSVHPDRFWVAFLGQTIVIAFRVFEAPLLPRVAAVWFGNHQIATACGISVVGYQAAMALSLLIPSLLIKGSNAEIEQGLYLISTIYAVFNATVAILLLLCFKDSPPTPPSIAQKNYTKKRKENPVNFITELKLLITNKNYLLYTIIFGINIAAASPFQVLSNQIILKYYEDGSQHVSTVGIIYICFMVIGTMGASVCLDKFKKFRLISITTDILFWFSILLYTMTLTQGIHFVYISSAVMGIFFGSASLVGIEVVVELTYPQAQNLAVGVSAMVGQIGTIIMTSIFAPIFRSFGFHYASIILLGTLFVTDLLYIFIKFDCRRQAAQVKAANVDPNIG